MTDEPELKKIRVYIVTPRTGLHLERNQNNVDTAWQRLERAGYEPVFDGLAEIDIIDKPSMEAWVKDMRLRLTTLLTCDGVALMPGWTSDIGSVLEMHIARNLKMKFSAIDNWTVEPLTWDMVLPEKAPQLPTDRSPTPREWRDWYVRLSLEEQVKQAAGIQAVMSYFVNTHQGVNNG